MGLSFVLSCVAKHLRVAQSHQRKRRRDSFSRLAALEMSWGSPPPSGQSSSSFSAKRRAFWGGRRNSPLRVSSEMKVSLKGRRLRFCAAGGGRHPFLRSRSRWQQQRGLHTHPLSETARDGRWRRTSQPTPAFDESRRCGTEKYLRREAKIVQPR